MSGKKNSGADAASRYPPPTTPINITDSVGDPDVAEDSSVLASASHSLYTISNVITWDMIREATTSDTTLQRLHAAIREGFPADPRQLPRDIRPYHRIADSLCSVDGVILSGGRIVIPASLRRNITDALHAAHQGVSAMCARAADSVFWPNITVDIQRTRDECDHCHRSAKSNPMQPPLEIVPPEYPFQKIASDYFSYNNHEYLVVVDRYSNWPMLFRSERGAEGLVKRLREVFVTFGVPEELTSDGGSEFTAGKTQDFLKSWDVRHRLTSVANPHANCRAEIAVKTVKRMLMDNTSSNGSIDIDRFQKAMLVYRNSIDPETRASPSLIVFGRPIRDPIPIPMGRYCPHPTWAETLTYRERALAKRHNREHEKWGEHTRALTPLKVGDHVYIQNLVGNHPRRWERTGNIVEVRQFDQYVVRVDGSGRLTIRNRKHLRKFTPFNSLGREELIESFTPMISHSEETPTRSTSTGDHTDSQVPTEPFVEEQPPELSEDGPLTPIAGTDHQSVGDRRCEAVGERCPTPADDSSRRSADEPCPAPPRKVPRALARLQPHNAPGLGEVPTRRLRDRTARD